MVSLQSSELNTYADIEAVLKCLQEKYGIQMENIILYGQSVGSGPTLDLASHLSQLRAVVLHSPILSGLRVMYPMKRTFWFDIYKVRTVIISNPYFSFLVIHNTTITISQSLSKHILLLLCRMLIKSL